MKGIDLGERFIKKIGILVSMMLVTSCSYKLKQVQPTSFTENKHLETNYPAEWKGTPLDRKGNFMNHEFPFEFRFYDVVKWKVGHNPQKSEKRNDKWMPETQTETGFLQSNEDMIVWLGHATFFVRINGIELITDPAFFDLPFAHRHASIPVDPSAFKKFELHLGIAQSPRPLR